MGKDKIVSLNLRVGLDQRVIDIARGLGLDLAGIKDILAEAAIHGLISTLETLQEARDTQPKH